jgi:hypothetical protein
MAQTSNALLLPGTLWASFTTLRVVGRYRFTEMRHSGWADDRQSEEAAPASIRSW